MKREIVATGPYKYEPNDPNVDVVLCKLPGNPVTPYVTWVRTKRDGETYWGHYHKDIVAAAKDFAERTGRPCAVIDTTALEATD